MYRMGQNISLKKDQKARACILGAIIGDSIGSTLEFSSQSDASKILRKYNNFHYGLVGKGPHNLIPGQFTDDTELALAIMQVIFINGEYNQKLVAKKYHQWYNSNPFDIGRATKNAFKNSSVKSMIDAANSGNIDSLSNGFLMRLFGLVAMYQNQPKKNLMTAIREDVALTHGHPEAKEIAKFYGLLLSFAIDNKSADEIYSIGKIFIDRSKIIQNIYQAVESNSDFFVCYGQKYYHEDISSHCQGFVGFSLWLLIKCIRQYNNYTDAITYILSFGGDTDTNACIVGAVMGALYPTSIPTIWIDNVCNCLAFDRYADYPIADPKIWTKWLPN